MSNKKRLGAQKRERKNPKVLYNLGWYYLHNLNEQTNAHVTSVLTIANGCI